MYVAVFIHVWKRNVRECKFAIMLCIMYAGIHTWMYVCIYGWMISVWMKYVFVCIFIWYINVRECKFTFVLCLMYICIHTCMYVCIHGWMISDAPMDDVSCIYVCMYLCTWKYLDRWMYLWNVNMFIYKYVCILICISIKCK